uniref:Uncharacterized protein n=1 Tax=Oryza nivara TaxID=4536 RepID=A0A0E0GLT6_ORYNI
MSVDPPRRGILVLDAHGTHSMHVVYSLVALAFSMDDRSNDAEASNQGHLIFYCNHTPSPLGTLVARGT